MVPKPIKGSFPWPGREHLSVRDRILIETRHCMDIFLAMSEIEGDPDSVVGYSEYLLMDWKWLHDPSFREKFPKYFSFHSSLLRFKEANCNYPAEIGWRGPIPRTNAVSDFIAAMLN